MTQEALASVTQAAAPLGTTVAGIVASIEKRYLSYVQRITALKEKGSTIKHRLFAARAMECASVLADYYRTEGNAVNADSWEYLRRRNEALAFNHKNAIAENIGAGTPTAGNDSSSDGSDQE